MLLMKGNMVHMKGNMAPKKGNMVLTKGNMAQRHVRNSWMKHCRHSFIYQRPCRQGPTGHYS